jgi:hypothetical protein
MKRDYKQFFAIIKQHGLEKEEVVLEFTKGETDSLSALKDAEFNELMRRLARYNKKPPGDQQRKKIIAIARQMHSGKSTKEIIKIIDGWCLKQKYAKPLMGLDLQQLGVMVTIYESKVLADYLSGLNK